MIRALAAAALLASAASAAEPPPKAEGAVRVATFNASLSRRNPGELVQALRLGDDAQVAAVAEIIQRVRPDILLINEIDYDPRHIAAELFRKTLRDGRGGAEGIDYPHMFTAPSNTGLLAPVDLDGDDEIKRPRDAFGFGWFEGQYGMALYSRLPLETEGVRTFQTQLWSEMPGALLPHEHYGEAANALRLSSKSHWDAPVVLPGGGRLRILASHPTPPVFDGPEDANGRRNHDEIRFWTDYINGADWMTDDAGKAGGLPPGALFVALGDLNADPEDGDGRREGIKALLAATQDPRPASEGGAVAPGKPGRSGSPSLHTADWSETKGPGNLRVDFVLPGPGLEIVASGVFWPAPGDPLRRLVGEGRDASSDHRLVWVDIR